MPNMRTESDSMGKIEVAADRYWGCADPALAAELQDRRRPLRAACDARTWARREGARARRHRGGRQRARSHRQALGLSHPRERAGRRLIRAQGRHNVRPAHGVTRAQVGRYVLHEDRPAPEPDVRGRWFSLEHTFVIVPGDDSLPPPPITAKTDGARAPLEVLTRMDRKD
jgi:hypothetical protein